MLDRLDETIVAVSSPPGHGELGIVRLSGKAALPIGDALTELPAGGRLADLPGGTHAWGEFLLDGEHRVPALFYVFRTPRSYTREDLVEVHTIGSPAVLSCVRRTLLGRGAVAALPGEFTARAYLSGALDLSAAEGVAGLIRARSDTQLRAARRVMEGAAGGRIAGVRDAIGRLLALVEADIDFVDEPIEFITTEAAGERLASIAADLEAFRASAVCVERFNDLPHVLLLGPSNAGKSSLMNRLSGVPRAICAAAAGTTRDVLSAPVRLGRSEAMLLDSAGVDGSSGEIEELAREGTLAAVTSVDAVCLVLDGAAPLDRDFIERIRGLALPNTLVVSNKSDLMQADEMQGRAAELEALGLGPVVVTSALTGTGMDLLRAALAEVVMREGGTTLGESILMTERQSAAIEEAIAAVSRATALLGASPGVRDCADVLAHELREALEQVAAVSGEVTSEDLLGRIFADFCIGK